MLYDVEDHRSSDAIAAELVVDYVRARIEAGELRPGDRLPPERQLAVGIGVSRPSVRAGLRTLAAMGVLQTRHGSGTYVSELPMLAAQPLSLLAALHGFTREQMYEARRVLEIGSAGLAAERATSDQIAVMADEVAGMYASLGSPATFSEHDVRFHRAVAAGSGNPILAALVEMVSSIYFEEQRKSPPRERDLRETAEVHRSIYHAVRSRDVEGARREMAQHLPRAKAIPMPVSA